MKYTIYDNNYNVISLEEHEIQPKYSTDNIYQGNFLKPKYNPDTNTFYEGATQQEIIASYIEKEELLYRKRIEDGKKAVAKISAEFRVSVIVGQTNEKERQSLEILLEPVRREILAGQWVSAKNILENIGMNAVGEQTYKKLLTEIDNYINENYEN